MGRDLERYAQWADENQDKIRLQTAERVRQYRAKHVANRLPLPFLAVDGEGGNRPDGRHVYTYLRAGAKTIYNPEGLTGYQALDFLWTALTEQVGIPVSFFFNYDVSMICRDMPPPKIASLCNREDRALAEKDRFAKVWHGQYGLDWLPGKLFSILRGKRNVVISDVASFYQCSFIRALDDWQVGTKDERASIRADKARRNTFTPEMGEREKDYNELEGKLLEQLCEALRTTCNDLDIHITRFQGAGNLASAMLKAKNIPKRESITTKDKVLQAAQNAYYGGRFESRLAGVVENVYQCDIASAYPHAMATGMPCPIHTRWTRQRNLPPLTDDSIYVAHITWDTYRTRNDCLWGPLPWRNTGGSIIFPIAGRGWYWSPELREAQILGFDIKSIGSVYVAHKQCECAHWDWIPERYQQRLALGKSDKGKVLKLGLNSLYGKMAQSIGTAPYADPIAAGLITSKTRARLLQTLRLVPWEHVLMFATDAVYMDIEPKLSNMTTTKELGGWEVSEPAELLIVQPGFYFHKTGAAVKSRGIPQQIIQTKYDEFREAWDHDGYEGQVSVDCGSNFIGIREASHRGNLAMAGNWIPSVRTIRYNLTPKREVIGGKHGTTLPSIVEGESTPYPKRFGRPPADADLTVYEHPNGDHPYVDRLPEWDA